MTEELFRPDGHLSDAGLRALADGGLDELQRLEAAEHLGFCQECMQRYLALLTDETLMIPPHDLRLPVARGIRARLAGRTFRRYATAAVAAALAMTLWGAGAFDWMGPDKIPSLPPPRWQQTLPPQPAPARENPLQQGFDSVREAMNAAFDDLSQKMNQPFHTMRGEQSHAEK